MGLEGAPRCRLQPHAAGCNPLRPPSPARKGPVLQAPFPPARAQVRHGTPSESHAAVHAIHKLLILIKESGHAEIQHSWWAELVVTFKTLLEQPAHREQAEPEPEPEPEP